MEFKLTYAGPLFSTGNKAGGLTKTNHKHEIRLAFDPQLQRLWQITESLRYAKSTGPRPIAVAGGKAGPLIIRSPALTAEQLAEKHVRNDWRFVPLVTRELDLWCGLDILFLRSGKSGSLLKRGDLDGRLKTLLDALAMPDQNQGYEKREQSPQPLYTLLEDDRLISKVSVETDELLEPPPGDLGFSDLNYVRLVISVRIRPYEANFGNIQFI